MDPRTASNAKSLNSTLEWLRDIIVSPEKYRASSVVLYALKTQGNLAKYENSEAGIKAMSLNTFKAVAAGEVPGGFNQFDSLRRQALDKLAQSDADAESKDGTKASKKRAIKRLASDVEALKAANLVLLRTVVKAMDDLNSVAEAKNDSVRRRLAAEAVGRIHASLSTNTPPYDTVSSTAIKFARAPA